MVQDVCIYVEYMQWNMCKMCKKRLLILYLCANVRILRYLPVRCVKGQNLRRSLYLSGVPWIHS